ncbi:MAG: 2-C-methyl-D-erythritol 4-phosphate cytidylyltransferase [Steroidobacteraceae bacterium]
MSAQVWFVVPAAGRSRRMGGAAPKQYLGIAGRTLVEHALAPLLASSRIAGGVVALAGDDMVFAALAPAADPRVRTCVGGAERADSVRSALGLLGSLGATDDWVLVHDAARPCLEPADLQRLIETCEGDPVGGLLATPLADTLKRADADDRVAATVERTGLWRALTPQMFRLGPLAEALDSCRRDGVTPTDEAAAIEHMGLRPRLVAGSPDNIKVTRPADIEAVRRWFAARGEGG